MVRLGRLALNVVCIACTVLVILPPTLARLDRHALSPGDRVNTQRDGTGEVEAVEGDVVILKVGAQLRRVPREEVKEL